MHLGAVHGIVVICGESTVQCKNVYCSMKNCTLCYQFIEFFNVIVANSPSTYYMSRCDSLVFQNLFMTKSTLSEFIYVRLNEYLM